MGGNHLSRATTVPTVASAMPACVGVYAEDVRIWTNGRLLLWREEDGPDVADLVALESTIADDNWDP